MEKLSKRLRGIELPDHWLPTLLISGTIFGVSQWVTRYTSGPTTILLRFLRFGLTNFYVTLVVNVSGVLLVFGWYSFAMKVTLLVKKKLGRPTAPSRAGRGAQKLLSKVLMVATYFACFFAPIYVMLFRTWLAAIFAVLVIQYPLHTLLRAARRVFSGMGQRSFKPRNIISGLRKTVSGIKGFFVWMGRYYFAASSLGPAEAQYAPWPGTWHSFEGEGGVTRRPFADTFSEFLERPTFLWREWSADPDHLYPDLDEALIVARENASAKSALEQEGSGFQLVAEIKHEARGCRLMALTVLPSKQVLQPDIQYRVSEFGNWDSGV